MLGRMRPARRRMADALAGCESVLDVGCGGGASTAALVGAGDRARSGASIRRPISCAAPTRACRARASCRASPSRPASPTRASTASRAASCSTSCRRARPTSALAELARILRPGARLAIVEPAAEQYQTGAWRLVARHGPLGAYFRVLARAIHEPFAAEWHRRDARAWLAAARLRGVESTASTSRCACSCASRRDERARRGCDASRSRSRSLLAALGAAAYYLLGDLRRAAGRSRVGGRRERGDPAPARSPCAGPAPRRSCSPTARPPG